jgi:hypothetical protein
MLSIGVVSIFTPTAADAHFKITAPSTPPTPAVVQSWMSQDAAGGPQKTGPCAAVPNTALGDSPGTPTHAVTVVQSGQTVTVPVTVTVAHPGWFRISLVEGPSASQTIKTLPDPQAQQGTKCTPAIMTNPVWSPTQPVLADGLPAGSTASTEQAGVKTFQVTIPPSAHCTAALPCTLQVVMVMTDHPATDCYYHHCADISVAASGEGGSGGGTSSTGGADSGGAGAVAGVGAGGVGVGQGGSVSSGGDLATAGGGMSGGAGIGGISAATGGAESTSGGSPGSSGGAEASGTAGSLNAVGTSGSRAVDTGASSEPGSGCSFVSGTPSEVPWQLSAVGVLGLFIARRRRRSH